MGEDNVEAGGGPSLWGSCPFGNPVFDHYPGSKADVTLFLYGGVNVKRCDKPIVPFLA